MPLLVKPLINMFNFSCKHETTDKNMSPDGQYVPRIMFVGMLLDFNLMKQTYYRKKCPSQI